MKGPGNMAKSLKVIIERLSIPFNLTLVNPRIDLNKEIENVRIIEHTYSIPHIKDNELIITTGIMLKKADDIIEFCEQLILKNVHGVIINLGPYIKELPASVIRRFSDSLPLITMPWEFDTIDLEKAIYSLLLDASQTISSVDECVKQYMNNIEQRPFLYSQLESLGYRYNAQLSTFILASDNIEELQNIHIHSIINIVKAISDDFIAYRQEQFIFLAFSDINTLSYKSLLHRLQRYIAQSTSFISLTIGPRNKSLSQVGAEYMQLLSFAQITLNRRQRVSDFKDSNLHDLLLSQKSIQCIENIYSSYYGKLVDYDANQNTSLTEVVAALFSCNFNRTEAAEKLYTHRNTIQNQINKIEGILNCSLKNPHDITCLYLSYLYHCYFTDSQ